MPFVIIIAGLVLLMAAIRDKTKDLGALLKSDFQGTGSSRGFVVWIAAIFCVGAIGVYKPLKPFSTALLGLIVLVLFLAKGQGTSFFSKLTSQINSLRS